MLTAQLLNWDIYKYVLPCVCMCVCVYVCVTLSYHAVLCAAVVVWCYYVGDLQWRQGSFPRDRPTHPNAEVGGRREDTQTIQRSMHTGNVSTSLVVCLCTLQTLLVEVSR